MEKKKVDLKEMLELLEEQDHKKKRKHNDELIRGIALEIKKSIEARQEVDITIITMYLRILELLLKK